MRLPRGRWTHPTTSPTNDHEKFSENYQSGRISHNRSLPIRDNQGMDTTDPSGVDDTSAKATPIAHLDIDCDELTCAALSLNGFPFVHSVSIEATEPIASSVLSLSIDGFPRCTITQPVAHLRQGQRAKIGTGRFQMPLELLHGFTERRYAEIEAALIDDSGTVLARETKRIAIAPETHWPGIGPACHTLVSFVTPNSTGLNTIIHDISRRLALKTGEGALDGYLRRRPDRVQRIAEACYEAVASLGLTYQILQASFEKQGQKVRVAEDVVRDRLGNCLDLSTMLATFMENAGLHPFLVLGDRHALVGFFTNGEHFPDALQFSPSHAVSRTQLGEAIVVEATLMCGEPSSFADAVQKGRHWLESATENVIVVDVRASRLAGIHPMAAAIERNAGRADAPVEAPTGDFVVVQPADLPPLPKPTRSKRANRIDIWKTKLLDLTLRNRLLNDSFDSQLPLAAAGEGALAALLETLNSETTLKLRPTLGMPLAMAESDIVSEVRSGVLRTRLVENELDDRATKAHRSARSSLEETGARSLFVAVGFLEYFVDNRKTALRAPLLLVPIAMERISRAEGYRIQMVPDDIVANVALVEYLRSTQGKDIQLAAQLVGDGSVPRIRDVFAYVRQAIKDVPGMRVIEAAKIGIYSFKKLPLFEEMRQRSDALENHPVLGALLDRDAGPELRSSPLIQPSDVAREARYAAIRLPLPADSSQTAAILSAAAGSTFILQGPPGTGKSQTITNLLVECMARGKRVLFVAEKSAALQVVAERLRRTGLDAFALDLHADNANKTQFVTQVKTALDFVDRMHGFDTSGLRSTSTELDTFSDRIQSAADALHHSLGDGLSVFAAIDRACAIDEQVPGARNHPSVAGTLDGGLAEDAGAAEIADRVERTRTLATAFSGLNPGTATHLADFAPKRPISPEEANTIAEQASSANNALATWHQMSRTLAQTLGLHEPATVGDARTQSDLAKTIPVSHAAAPWLAGLALGDDYGRKLDACAQALRLGQAAEDAIRSVTARYDRAVLDQPLPVWAGDLREAREKMALLRWLTTRKIRASLLRHAKTPPPRELVVLLADIEQLIAEKQAIDAASPVSDLLANFQSGGQPIDYAASRVAVDAALAFAEAARRLVPSEVPAMAQTVPASIVQGRVQPASAAATAAEQAWNHAVVSVADCGPLPEMGHPGCTFAGLTDQLARLRDHRLALPGWSLFALARSRAEAAGLRGVGDALLSGALDPVRAPHAVEAELLTAWTRLRLRSNPNLADCAHQNMDTLRHRFRAGIELYRRGVPGAVAESVRQNVQAQWDELSDSGSRSAVNTLTGLRAQNTIRRSIRKVVSDSAPALAALKPIVLASPLTAATHLPPDFPEFDLVVFDEASQVPVWDAACAITRGRACVVVGDSKQLPPTRFFDRKENSETNADISEETVYEDALEPLESVLDEAVASGLPQQSLLWHYRSRDERLIEFSNRRSYGAQLKTFPAPCQAHDNLGVEFRYVGGVYNRGQGSTNLAEAKAVVAEIRRRLLDESDCPANRSIGVVTFSVSQQTLVQDLLDDALDQDPRLRVRAVECERNGEWLFVKNLENVQGDERATMLFSICYGPSQDGKLYYHFGPLNLTGGERRLNVAVSRAREKVVVFSSIRSSDLDPQKCQSAGVRDLRDYLEFAEFGTVPETRDESILPGSIEVNALERRLARRLEARGFVVDQHVGRSNDYRISLAIARPENPETWVLGVELDGAFQRTAPTVADREVVRTGVLHALGWRTLSVSAVDLLRDEDAVVERIVAAAEGAGVLVR